MRSQKNTFSPEIPKIHPLHNFADNRLSKINWVIDKLGNKMPHTCRKVTEGFKISKITL